MLSACIEMLFKAEHASIADRIRAAHVEAIERVEFWTWRDKDILAIERALQETGIGLTCLLLDPKTDIVEAMSVFM